MQKEPNIKAQIDDLEKQYKDNLISTKEYAEALDRIRRNHAEWIRRNR